MITFNSKSEDSAIATVAAAKSQRGDEACRLARYASKCPQCGKQIQPGSPVVPMPREKRSRWKHQDCNNVPVIADAAIPSGAACDVQARHDAEVARSLAANLGVEVSTLRNRLGELEQRAPKRIVVEQAGREAVEIEGHVHPAFEEILELAAAREHVFLPGPSGSGKSHIARQVATALGLEFGAISCSAGMSESQLLGRMVPQGDSGAFEFLGAPFLECYENGGVFLFDEIDAADSNVLLVVNSALANGHLNVPARHGKPVAVRHPDFICIAAANTFGRGADRVYCGRNALDEATLDRFRIGTVPMDYDPALERSLWDGLCPNGEGLTTLWRYRSAIASNRLERILSTRFIIAAAKAIARGKDMGYVESKLFAGWRDDEVRKVRG